MEHEDKVPQHHYVIGQGEISGLWYWHCLFCGQHGTLPTMHTAEFFGREHCRLADGK